MYTQQRLWGGVVLALLAAGCAPDGVTLEPATGSSGKAVTSAAFERYIVAFKPQAVHVNRGKADIAQAGGQVVRDLSARHGFVAARLPEQARLALLRNPHIEHIELDGKRYLDWAPPLPATEPSYDVEFQGGPLAPQMPYGTEMVRADEVSLPDNSGVLVCIIDSGYSPGHGDLGSTDVTGVDSMGVVQNLDSPDYGNPVALPWDEDGDGHGSHVAGTIRALDNGYGVRGVFPGAKLHIVRVFADDGYWAYASDLVHAVDQCWDEAVAQDSRLVVNMSLGGDQPSTSEEQAFSDYYNDASGRALFIGASGNGCTHNPGNGSPNDDCTDLHYPSAYDAVIAVGAVDYEGELGDFSQYGTTQELVAPGVDILSVINTANSVVVGSAQYHGVGVTGGAAGTVSGAVLDGGTCLSADASWTGAIVVCTPTLNALNNATAYNAAGLVFYDDNLYWNLGTTVSYPVIALGSEQGGALKALSGQSATIASQVAGDGYEHWDGTSMATPHVTGVAALIWAHDTRWSNAKVRAALQAGAYDLGDSGRDDEFGYGLVQAPNALHHLSGCAANGFCNTLCYGDGSSDPDCANYSPTLGQLGVQLDIPERATLCVAGDSQQDCKGYAVVLVTENDTPPYNVIRLEQYPDTDLSAAPLNVQLDVRVTGDPVYLWGFLYESNSWSGTFSTDDLLSTMQQVTVSATATINRDVDLTYRY